MPAPPGGLVKFYEDAAKKDKNAPPTQAGRGKLRTGGMMRPIVGRRTSEQFVQFMLKSSMKNILRLAPETCRDTVVWLGLSSLARSLLVA